MYLASQVIYEGFHKRAKNDVDITDTFAMLYDFKNSVMQEAMKLFVYRDEDGNVSAVYDPSTNNHVSFNGRNSIGATYENTIDVFPFDSGQCYGATLCNCIIKNGDDLYINNTKISNSILYGYGRMIEIDDSEIKSSTISFEGRDYSVTSFIRRSVIMSSVLELGYDLSDSMLFRSAIMSSVSNDYSPTITGLKTLTIDGDVTSYLTNGIALLYLYDAADFENYFEISNMVYNAGTGKTTITTYKNLPTVVTGALSSSFQRVAAVSINGLIMHFATLKSPEIVLDGSLNFDSIINNWTLDNATLVEVTSAFADDFPKHFTLQNGITTEVYGEAVQSLKKLSVKKENK